MPNPSASRQVTVTNEQGLHLRPAGALVKLARGFQARIELVREGNRFDAKSVLDIMTLGAVKGTQLNLEAVGDDAERALEAIVQAFQSGFAEHSD